MPISTFLRGREVPPTTAAAMNAAFLQVCERLGLTDKADPATALVAEKVIELAHQGELQHLAEVVLSAFKPGAYSPVRTRSGG
jgi:hypothetical protein